MRDACEGAAAPDRPADASPVQGDRGQQVAGLGVGGGERAPAAGAAGDKPGGADGASRVLGHQQAAVLAPCRPEALEEPEVAQRKAPAPRGGPLERVEGGHVGAPARPDLHALFARAADVLARVGLKAREDGRLPVRQAIASCKPAAIPGSGPDPHGLQRAHGPGGAGRHVLQPGRPQRPPPGQRPFGVEANGQHAVRARRPAQSGPEQGQGGRIGHGSAVGQPEPHPSGQGQRALHDGHAGGHRALALQDEAAAQPAVTGLHLAPGPELQGMAAPMPPHERVVPCPVAFRRRAKRPSRPVPRAPHALRSPGATIGPRRRSVPDLP